MGKLFRRALAFMLGMVFGISALVGSVVGGAYWAYKNVKPLDIANKEETIDGLGDLEDASIEELLNLVAEAVSDPNEYTIKRLEAEYGLNLEGLLESAGINSNDYSQVDINAIRDVSIFSLFGQGDTLFDSLKVRAIYVFLPKLLGKPMDELLSTEAQNLIGEYSISQFISAHPVTGELGAVSALKNLKVGAVLPALYDAVYDRDSHQYIYELKDGNDGILALLGNVYIGSVLDIAEGSDVLTELMEGGLKSISKMTIKEVLSTIASSASSDLAIEIEKRARAFGDTTIADLFKKVDGKYTFTEEKIIESIELGYLLGYEKGEDSIWYVDEGLTTPVEGINNALASANIKDVLENKDDFLMMVKAGFGDVTVGDLTNSMGISSQLPEGFKKLNDITLGEIIGDGKDVFGNIRRELSVALEDTSLAELFSLNSNSSVLDSIYSLKVGKLLDPSLTGDEILQALQNALNGIAFGDLLGYKRDEAGNWNFDNKYLHPFLDITFGEAPAGISLVAILSIFASGGVAEMGQALFGDLSLGDVYCGLFKFEYDEASEGYYKVEGEEKVYVDEDFSKFLHVKLWQLLATFDKNSEYVLYEDVKDLSIGETYYSMALALNKMPSGMTYVKAGEFEYLENMEEDGYALENSDARQLSEILFQIDLEEIETYKNDNQHWLDKLEPVKTKSLIGMFLTEEQEEANAMLKAILGVTIGDMLGLLKGSDGSGKDALSNMVTEHFDTVTLNGVETKVYLGDAFEMVAKDWRNSSLLETFGNLEFAKSVTALLGTSSRKDAFGYIKLVDIIEDYLTEKMEGSDLIMATLNVTFDDICKLLGVRNDTNEVKINVLFHEILEPLYEGLTVLNCVDDFANLGDKLSAYAPILDMQVNTILHNTHEKRLDLLLDDFKKGMETMGKKEKLYVLGAGSVVVLALYEVDNPTLVRLLTNAFGEETWGDYLAERLGYSFVEDSYVIEGVYNPIMDKILKQKICETLDRTKCSIRGEYINELTFGQLLTAHKSTFRLLEDANKDIVFGSFASDENGDIFIDGDWEQLTKVLFRIKPIDVYENKGNLKKFIVDNVLEVKIGDVVAGFVKRTLNRLDMEQGFSIDENGNYIVTESFKNLCEKFYNITINEFKNNPQGIIKDNIKNSNVGDLIADFMNMVSEKYISKEFNGKAILSADGTKWTAKGDYDEILNIVYNLSIIDTLKGFANNGKQYFKENEEINGLKIGYFFAKGNNQFDEDLGIWRDSSGEPIAFIKADGVIKKAIYNLTVGQVADSNFEYDDILNGIYLGEVLGYECNNQILGHVHTDSCVWYESTKAYVQGEKSVGLQDVKVKLGQLNQSIASLEFSQVIADGFDLDIIFKKDKLGDVMGLWAVTDGDTTTWFEPLKIDEYLVVDSANFGNVVLSSKPASVLVNTLASIDASEFVSANAVQTIIEKIEALKLGYVLDYTYDNGVWYKQLSGGGQEEITGVFAKLCDYTILEIEDDTEGIINSWKISDIISNSELEENSILNCVKDVEISNVSTAINDVLLGQAMGYEKKVDNKWYGANGLIVTDEVMLILADYKIGEVVGKYDLESGKSFSNDIVDKMLTDVSLGTIYPNAGQGDADGFMAILDPSWKLGNLSDNLMNKLKTDTTIDQLIEFGVFGDYFVCGDGYTNETTPSEIAGEKTNYGLIDSIFDKKAESLGYSNEREYWLSLSMPNFMSSLMETLTSYQQWFIDNRTILENQGIQLPF